VQERNPLLGRRPLSAAVAAFFAVLLAGAVLSTGAPAAPVAGTAARRSSSAPSPAARPLPRFGRVTVSTARAVDGPGTNIDSIAFWRAPRPAGSLMFVTSKGAPLVEVWRHPYGPAAARPPLTDPCLGGAGGRGTNGVAVDQRSDRLYVSSGGSRRVCVFSLPRLTRVRTITSRATYGTEPNLTLLGLAHRATRLYVSDDDIVYVRNASTGRKLTQFEPPTMVEAMWGDSFRRVLYVPDEDGTSGVHAYHAGGAPYRHHGRSRFGGSFFQGDAEGVLEYACRGTGRRDDGTGLLVVSDQLGPGNDYEVFDRSTWAHLGTIQLRRPGGSGRVALTDGIGSIQQASARYPKGYFAAVDDNSRVVGVGWRQVFKAISTHIGRPFRCGAGTR
jgi:hypothetical protein